MGGMHFQLNSEDQALLGVVELAVGKKGQSAVEGDASLEGFCYRLASASSVADAEFRDGLLARLQGAMGADVQGVAEDVEWIWDVGDKDVAGGLVVAPSSARHGSARLVRQSVSDEVEIAGSGGSLEGLRRAGLALMSMAAVLVLLVGLAAMLISMQNGALSRLSPGLVGPSTDGSSSGPAMMATATTASLSEPTATTASAFFAFQLLTVGPRVTVTPVDSAAFGPGMQLLYRLPMQADSSPVVWSPDGKMLAARTGSDIQVWAAQSGTLSYSTSSREGAYSLAWSPDGNWLAEAFADGSVDLWSARDGSRLGTLTPPGDGGAGGVFPADMYPSRQLPDVAWSPDGRMLASVANLDANANGSFALKGMIYVWDVANGLLARSLSLGDAELQGLAGGSGDVILEVEWSPDGTMVAALYGSYMIGVWDIATGRFSRTLSDSDPYGNGALSPEMEWSAGGRWLAQPFYKSVDLWDMSNVASSARPVQLPRANVVDNYDALLALAWSPREEVLATLDGLYKESAVNLRLWDAASGTQMSSYQLLVGAGVSQRPWLAWSPDAQVIAHTLSGVMLWGVASKLEIRRLQVEHPQGAWWSPDGSMLAVLGSGGLEVWGIPAVGRGQETPTPRPPP